MDTLDYYQRMAKANGGMDKVQTWSRMFLVPGMYHCRGGEFALDNFDLLTAAGRIGWRRARLRIPWSQPGKLSQAAADPCAPIRNTRITRAKAIRKMRRTSNAANDDDTRARTKQRGVSQAQRSNRPANANRTTVGHPIIDITGGYSVCTCRGEDPERAQAGSGRRSFRLERNGSKLDRVSSRLRFAHRSPGTLEDGWGIPL